jgi:hypothetical protein
MSAILKAFGWSLVIGGISVAVNIGVSSATYWLMQQTESISIENKKKITSVSGVNFIAAALIHVVFDVFGFYSWLCSSEVRAY